MNKNIAELKKITTDFYIKTAKEFDKTRKYEWDGWVKLMDILKSKGVKVKSVLDVACGNGRFVNTLQKHFEKFTYLGIDNNKFLIGQAIKTFSKTQEIEFREFDLYQDWQSIKEEFVNAFDLVVAFGITHHLVDIESREKFLTNLKSMLSEDGYIVISFWDFLGSEQLSKKISEDLGDGDYILDWKRGEVAYRYAHHYTKEEILDLFKKCNLEIVENYSADGPNGKSNDCYILKIS
jgi:SAM-dependent methyltransferase